MAFTAEDDSASTVPPEFVYLKSKFLLNPTKIYHSGPVNFLIPASTFKAIASGECCVEINTDSKDFTVNGAAFERGLALFGYPLKEGTNSFRSNTKSCSVEVLLMKRMPFQVYLDQLIELRDHQSPAMIDDEVEVVSLRLSQVCPITLQPLRWPCKGAACAHAECFDLVNWLGLVGSLPCAERTCPICGYTRIDSNPNFR